MLFTVGVFWKLFKYSFDKNMNFVKKINKLTVKFKRISPEAKQVERIQ